MVDQNNKNENLKQVVIGQGPAKIDMDYIKQSARTRNNGKFEEIKTKMTPNLDDLEEHVSPFKNLGSLSPVAEKQQAHTHRVMEIWKGRAVEKGSAKKNKKIKRINNGGQFK